MFEVKGAVPESQLVYQLFEDKDFGDVVTYEQLDAALGRDFRSQRGPLYKADDMLLRNRSRALAAVKNEGYRVVQAREHETLGRSRHRRARKQINQAVRVVTGTDRSALTEDERRRLSGLELALSRQQQMIRRLDDAVTQHDADLRDLRQRTSNTEDLLKRHGIS